MALDTTSDAGEAWRLIRNAAINAKRYSSAFSSELAAGDATLERIFEMYRLLKNIRDQIESLKATPGLVAYVQLIRNDDTYDVSTDIDAVSTEMQDALTWVDSNAASLNLSGDTAANYLDSGSVVSDRFTPTQTSGLRTRLGEVVAAIT